MFQDANRIYPIQGVTDKVPSASYPSGTKGWMDKTEFTQYISERKVFIPLLHERKRILFVDNCSGHGMSTRLEEALR